MRCQAAAFDTERRPKLPCVSLADSTTTPERSMLRSAIALRILALVALIYSLSIVRRHYVFQHYLRTRQITANNFPAPYIQVLNESVARNEQPPLDFDALP
jgi:hypothetical protein